MDNGCKSTFLIDIRDVIYRGVKATLKEVDYAVATERYKTAEVLARQAEMGLLYLQSMKESMKENER